MGQSGDRVLLHPDDVQIVYTEDGELVGYAVERSLLRPAMPAPGSLPKLPQSVFNMENDRGR